jgi:predicted RNA-binding Zn-ribbon protein involved in translation (DUF1610 family)
MRDLTPAERMFAEQAAARHRIPKATVTHPAVIVPGDEFMTEKLRDPDYVPYCGPCVPMQRVRRTVFGFECPACGNKANYDLTCYDGNKHVQYAGEPPAPEDALAGFPPVPGEYWKFGRYPDLYKLLEYRAQHAERKAWNDKVEARKATKKGSK